MNFIAGIDIKHLAVDGGCRLWTFWIHSFDIIVILNCVNKFLLLNIPMLMYNQFSINQFHVPDSFRPAFIFVNMLIMSISFVVYFEVISCILSVTDFWKFLDSYTRRNFENSVRRENFILTSYIKLQDCRTLFVYALESGRVLTAVLAC
jgi:hypothetical protein